MSFAQSGNSSQPSGPGFFSEFNTQNQSNQGAHGKGRDPSDKWNHLQQKSFQNLTTISSDTNQVKRMISKIGSHEDSAEFRSKIRIKLNEIRDLCTSVSDDIKVLKKMSTENSDPSVRSERKIICGKIAKDFSDCLLVYQQLSQEWMAKEKKNIPIPQKPSPFSSQNRFYSDTVDEEKQALLAATRQQLSLVENDLDVNDEIIAEREKGIEEVQSAMLEVNEMFRDLNTIVVEQAPLVDSIENHIEHARFDVEKGVEEIEKASDYQKKAGSKTKVIVCLLIIIMIFILLVVALSIYVFN
eukprot:CAMPEP_0117031602 /NCGR_PEP_ID=MMETSP0472-20121206/22697_1 /TAXON_ID=693140 ORGANISM="Tiarina fusus, Strain LIS" /NCGR_SAMPLE_ID=MMETSP0472 /ASSEMBLY_ACC=CAM_ASM_000603 /LENGTH=298 /DNA_ID=CAMNT_0004739965 /DNA_START=16 /DNA_END=912 /DNA_ORIENTATION=-